MGIKYPMLMRPPRNIFDVVELFFVMKRENELFLKMFAFHAHY